MDEAQTHNTTDHATPELPPPETGVRHGPLHIRPARRSDMAVIARMVSSSADWYRPIVDEKDMAEHQVDEQWEEKNFRRRDFYVASYEGKPVGCLSLQTFGDWVYLGYIYFFVDYVGKGFGQALLGYALERTEEMGAEGLCLIAHPEATWARRAYLKFGFEITHTDREDVLAWQGGALRSYYEEGFELYQIKTSAALAPAAE